jgi:hypothetical protein
VELALVTLGITQPICLSVQEGVQRLLHAAPHDPIEVVLDPIVVNRDDIGQRTRCIVQHGGSFCAVLVAFSHLQFSQIRRRQPHSNVRKIHYVIGADRQRRAIGCPTGRPPFKSDRSLQGVQATLDKIVAPVGSDNYFTKLQ